MLRIIENRNKSGKHLVELLDFRIGNIIGKNEVVVVYKNNNLLLETVGKLPEKFIRLVRCKFESAILSQRLDNALERCCEFGRFGNIKMQIDGNNRILLEIVIGLIVDVGIPEQLSVA